MEISEVIPQALAAGLVSDDEVVWQGARVDSIGRSHPVFRLSVGGEPRAYFKYFEPSRGATDGDPRNEHAVVALAAERPDVANAIAEGIAWNDSSVVVTRPQLGSPAWSLDHAGGGPVAVLDAWRQLVDRAIPALARLHLATRDLAKAGAIGDGAPLGGPVPWGLRLFSEDAPIELWSDPVLGPLLNTAGQERVLRDGVRAARLCWRRMCLVHGDLKHDNVLVHITAEEGASVTFVDWEMARIGDPAWDLAALLARLIIVANTSNPWDRQAIDGATTLLNGYVAVTGLARPAVAKRLVLYTGAWLTMSAVQQRSADQRPDADHDAASLMAKATETFRLCRSITERLIGIDEAESS